MERFITKSIIFKSWIETIVFYFLSGILLAILSLVIWQVVSRYFLGNPSIFTEELVRFLLLWLGCLSAVYAFGQDRHIALTYLTEKFSTSFQHKLIIIHHVVILLFALLFFLYGGFLLMNITTIQVSSVLSISMHYVFAIFPFCGIILAFYKIVDILVYTDTNNK
ncbi:MAG: TRAP transporter small permease [Brevinema sp.]